MKGWVMVFRHRLLQQAVSPFIISSIILPQPETCQGEGTMMWELCNGARDEAEVRLSLVRERHAAYKGLYLNL